jgi:hypothetical protein
MATSTAIIGEATTLGYSADGTTYTAIAEVLDVTMPETTTEKVKVTSYDTDDKQHEYIPGWRDGSDVDVEVIYFKTLHNTLKGFADARAIKFWKITYPDGSSDAWKGFITKFGGGSVPMDDKLVTKMSINLNNKVTYTAGA